MISCLPSLAGAVCAGCRCLPGRGSAVGRGSGAGDREYDNEVVPWASHSLAFMTELVELQHWRCPWCGDYLPDSPRGTAIDHIIPRVYGGTASPLESAAPAPGVQLGQG